MKKIEFATEVKAIIEERYPDKEANLNEVTKNNDMTFTQISIRGKDERVAPSIAIEYGEDPIAEADRICKVYEEAQKNSQDMNFDLDFVQDWERVKNCITPRIINKDMNKEFLKGLPFRDFEDLAIYYVIDCQLFKNPRGDVSSIRVSDEMLKIWEKTEKELFEQSVDNINTETQVEDILDVLGAMGYEIPGEAREEQAMIVITNKKNIYGAASILVPEVCEKLSERLGGNFYVFPSSIHELIAVPAGIDEDVTCLKDMVAGINQSVVSPDIFLSDNIYIFDAEKKMLKIAG